MATERIWQRIGDGGDYEEFPTIEAAADELSVCLSYPATAARYIGPALRGVVAGEFQGNNEMSLFWGGDEAEYLRELSDEELELFNECLAYWEK